MEKSINAILSVIPSEYFIALGETGESHLVRAIPLLRRSAMSAYVPLIRCETIPLAEKLHLSEADIPWRRL